MLTNAVALIPAYNPDMRLVELIIALKECGFDKIVVVDDGSEEKCQEVFNKAVEHGVSLCKHSINLGKGRALKTGFNYILRKHPEYSAICIDSDGQHDEKDAARAACLVEEHPKSLVLGYRKFYETPNIPFANLFGNIFTRFSVFALTGMWFRDTQNGLRGYSPEIMRKFIELPGERFEFETAAFLFVRYEQIKCVEFPIKVHYDKKGAYKTNFRRVIDSLLIYKTLFCVLYFPILVFLATSVIVLLTLLTESGYVKDIIKIVAPFALGWGILSIRAKHKIALISGGLLLSILYALSFLFLCGKGYSIAFVYGILVLPFSAINLLFYNNLGYGRRPRIIHFKK